MTEEVGGERWWWWWWLVRGVEVRQLQLTCDEFCHMTAPANFGLREISKNRSSFFPTLTGVKFTAIKVIIYASIFYCKKLPFVVEKYFLLLQV